MPFSEVRALTHTRLRSSIVPATVLMIVIAAAFSYPTQIEAATQTDGTQPLVAGLARYENSLIRPYVNLYSGNLVVYQRVQGGQRWNGPTPVLDPGDDLLIGSSPAARSVTGPEASMRAGTRIPLQRALGVALYYNASDTSGVVGVGGWRHSYQVTLDFSDSCQVSWGDGRRDVYRRKMVGPDTTWVGNAPLEARAIVMVGGNRELKAQHGGAYVFDVSGRLIKVRDRVGTQTDLSYDGSGRLVQVSILGRSTALSFVYDGSGRLSQILGDTATPTLLQYDGTGRLSGVTDRAGYSVQYQYDASNRLIRIVEQDSDALEITYYVGLPVVRDIRMGNTSRRTFSFDGASRTTRVYDQLDASTYSQIAYHFDARGLCTAVDDDGDIFSSIYDPLTFRRLQYTDANSHTVTASYDTLGNLTRVTDPLGNHDDVTYEPLFHLASGITDASGVSYSITRDSNGNPTQIADAVGNATHFTWLNPCGSPCTQLLSAIVDARSNTTGFVNDATFWHVTSVVDPAGNNRTFGYLNGNVTSTVDELGNTSSATYTARDELASVTMPGGITSTLAWSATGQLQSRQLPSGALTTYTYDSPGRVVRVTNSLGNPTNLTRDYAGRVTRASDALGHATNYAYDAHGRVVSMTDADGSVWAGTWDCCQMTSRMDPTGQTINFSYDARGLLTSRTSAGVSYTYSYDPAGRMLGASAADGDTVVTHTYSYDTVGRLIGHDQTGIALSTHYDLDAGGLPIRIWDTGRADSVRFVWDRRGMPTRVTAPVGGVNFQADLTWDARAQLTGRTFNTGVTSANTYDALGRLATIDHIGNAWDASYDFTHNLDSWPSQVNANHPGLGPVTLDLPRDSANRLTGEQYTPGRDFGYSYDAADRRVLKTTPDGNDTYIYTSGDRLLSAGTALLSWDAAGRCTHMVVSRDTLDFTYRSDGTLSTISRKGPYAGNAITGTWRATVGPFGEIAGWVLPDSHRIWFGYDRTRAGLLRRSTSLVHFGVQFRDDYIFLPRARAPLMWEFRGGGVAFPDSTRRRAMLQGPFKSVAEVAMGGGAGTGKLLWKRLFGPLGEAADPPNGVIAPLQGFAGLDIVPRNNGAGSTLPGIPDSILVVDAESGALYAPKLGRFIGPQRPSIAYFINTRFWGPVDELRKLMAEWKARRNRRGPLDDYLDGLGGSGRFGGYRFHPESWGPWDSGPCQVPGSCIPEDPPEDPPDGPNGPQDPPTDGGVPDLNGPLQIDPRSSFTGLLDHVSWSDVLGLADEVLGYFWGGGPGFGFGPLGGSWGTISGKGPTVWY